MFLIGYVTTTHIAKKGLWEGEGLSQLNPHFPDGRWRMPSHEGNATHNGKEKQIILSDEGGI